MNKKKIDEATITASVGGRTKAAITGSTQAAANQRRRGVMRYDVVDKALRCGQDKEPACCLHA